MGKKIVLCSWQFLSDSVQLGRMTTVCCLLMLFSLLKRYTMTLCLSIYLLHSSTCVQQIGTTKCASVPLVWNGAEISSQYSSQAPEGSWIWWLCPAVLLDDSADPKGVLRAFLTVSTQSLLKAAMQDITGSFSIPRAGQICSLSQKHSEDYDVKARPTHLEG